jgi:hypothetical protein
MFLGGIPVGRSFLIAVVLMVAGVLLPSGNAEPQGHPAETAGTRKDQASLEVGAPSVLPTLGRIWQVLAAAAPDNPDGLVACTFETDREHGREPSVLYASFDAGNTWMRTKVDHSSDWVSETSCAYGDRGRVYFADSASDTSHGGLDHERGTADVFRSRDGGLTWSDAEKYPFIDWTSLFTVAGTSEKVYLFGNNVARGFGGKGNGEWVGKRGPMSISEDGSPFGPPVFPAIPPEKDKYGLFPLGAVGLPDGAVLMLFGKLTVPRSDSEYVLYKSDQNGYRPFSRIALPKGNLPSLGARLAVDKSSRFPGRLYVALSNEENGRSVLVLAVSDDGGTTWQSKSLLEGHTLSEPKLIRGGFAGVAVDRTGVVGIEWATSEDCPVFVISLDGGESVGEPLPLGGCKDEIASEAAPGYAANQFWPLSGDSNFAVMMHPRLFGSADLVADAAGRFHPFWVEVTPGGNLSLQTESITVRGQPAPKEPAPNLATFLDLTKDVTVRLVGEQFNPHSATFDLDVAVQNSSKQDNVIYPSLIEVTQGSSDCGRVSYLNAAFTSSNGSPVLRIPTAGAHELLPGERTLPVHLRVRVEGCENDRGQLVALSRKGLQEFGRFFAPLRMQFRVVGPKPEHGSSQAGR